MSAANETISASLAHFAAETRFEQLAPPVVEMSKRCLLDGLGVMLAATTLGEGCGSFVELALEQGGVEQSSVLGTRRKLPALMAAFANGALAHALDFEDAHDRSLVHPNAATIPAALAVAEAVCGVSGKQLLCALAVGSEVVCRLGAALRVALDAYGWYPPPILGAFGATAAAGHLYGLSAGQMLDAFSLTLCQATCSAEIKHSPHSVVRSVRDAFPAKAGVLSAQLARKGVRGFERPFEGDAGFFALYARGDYEPAEITDQLGERFAIETISFKPWPTCRGTHAYIEAVLALLDRHAIATADIEQVVAFGHPIARMLCEPLEHKRRPQTAIDAKFSIPFAIATALHHRAVQLEHFAPAALSDRDVLELAGRVRFEMVTTDRHNLEHATAGSLEIEMRGGRRFGYDVPIPYGHPSHPMSDRVLIEKFVSCARHAAQGMETDASQRLVERVLSLEDSDDVGLQLCALL